MSIEASVKALEGVDSTHARGLGKAVRDHRDSSTFAAVDFELYEAHLGYAATPIERRRSAHKHLDVCSVVASVVSL